jgi:cation-transporting ATPase 13A3/4/5
MLVKSKIYARMSPDQKQFLVENLQLIGYVAGFCGDGTNDCGALKVGDIGLSLSEAEASVAAPFTSKDKDLGCVLEVIRQGRVALVTSFCCFKYMALYSLIQFTSVSLLYSIVENIGDFQFMFIDICIIIPIAVFMGRTGPCDKIDKKRPTASLVSTKVLTSIIGQVLIAASVQIYMFQWCQLQSWYTQGESDMENEKYYSFENSIVFLISCYQYISIAVVFTVGPPYQSPIWKNLPLVSTLLSITAFTVFLTIYPTEFFLKILQLREFPELVRFYILFVAGLNFVCSLVSERVLFPILAKAMVNMGDRIYVWRKKVSIKRAKMRRWVKSGKIHKVVEEELKNRE